MSNVNIQFLEILARMNPAMYDAIHPQWDGRKQLVAKVNKTVTAVLTMDEVAKNLPPDQAKSYVTAARGMIAGWDDGDICPPPRKWPPKGHHMEFGDTIIVASIFQQALGDIENKDIRSAVERLAIKYVDVALKNVEVTQLSTLTGATAR